MSTHPLTGEFLHPEQEAAFLDHALPASRTRAGLLLVFHALFLTVLGTAGLAGSGPHGTTLAIALLAPSAVALGAAWQASCRCRSVRGTRSAVLAMHGVALAGIAFIAVMRPLEIHWHAISLAVTVLVIHAGVPTRFIHALLLAAGATAVFLSVALRLAGPTAADGIRIVLLPLLANAYGALAARQRNRAARLNFQERAWLRQAAARDHLTGCFNRRYIHDDTMRPAALPGPARDSLMTVVLCDIDHFKRINDTYGHAYGDVVLRSFATLLEQTTRCGIDSVVRYGGEEFVVILPDTDLDGGVQLAERLRRLFAHAGLSAPDGNGIVATTASFGVACTRLGDRDYHEALKALIAAADDRMYAAKRSGRNCIRAVQLPATPRGAALPVSPMA